MIRINDFGVKGRFRHHHYASAKHMGVHCMAQYMCLTGRQSNERFACIVYLADDPHTAISSKHVQHWLKHLQLCPCVLVLIVLPRQTKLSLQ